MEDVASSGEGQRRRRTTIIGKRIGARRSARPPAWPVRGLWEAASEEQKERAHRTCTAILELWLARKSCGQVARELGVSPVRVWQLSQSGLSGMLAGLLKQPRWRGRIEMAGMESGREELLRLRKVVKEQAAKLEAAEALITLLRNLPRRGPRRPEGEASGPIEGTSGGKKPGKASASRAAGRRDGLAANDGAGARPAAVGGGAAGGESAHAAGLGRARSE